jgi:hypothetical protein
MADHSPIPRSPAFEIPMTCPLCEGALIDPPKGYKCVQVLGREIPQFRSPTRICSVCGGGFIMSDGWTQICEPTNSIE